MVASTLSGSAAGPLIYQRRHPEKTVLYQAVEKHLSEFISRAEEAERPVPTFVRRELEGLLDCGVLEKGAIRLRCPCCGFDRLVAFSCKGRICPSCAARRMSETAAILVDQVLPKAPYRQWVLTVPVPLRYLVAYDPELMSEVIKIYVRAVTAHLVRVARREVKVPKGARLEPAAVVVPQRFNSALGLNDRAQCHS